MLRVEKTFKKSKKLSLLKTAKQSCTNHAYNLGLYTKGFNIFVFIYFKKS